MPQTNSEDYANARKLGMREYRRCVMMGKSPYPSVLDDIAHISDVLAEVPVGLVEIPLDLVAGTKTAGRTTAFAANFMPILKESTEFAYKWAALYSAQLDEGIRDPIKAYEYMGKFYVMEGNKRVSVSKYVGLSSIMADVTRVLPRRNGEKENRIYYEFLDFYKVCPMYGITFTQEGSYRKFARELGVDLKTPWPEDLMQEVRAGYANFVKLYSAKGGDKLELSAGDAFLVYLNFYPIGSLVDDASSLLSSRIERLWDEFQTENIDGAISLVEHPEDMKTKSGGILDALRLGGPSYSQEHPLRVAFIYDKNPDDSRWIYGHELGRLKMIDYFEGTVDAVRFDNCGTSESLAKAIDAAAADEDGLVFTTSPTMMQQTVRAAIHYPRIKFLNCSINLSSQAVRTYYVRMYEAKFILGALAATEAKNHKIGYLADYPIYGCIANINAFAIGAAMIDPQVKIYLDWSTKKGADWKAHFASEGISIVSGPDMIIPRNPSREYGLYRYEEDGRITNLAAPVWDWGKYYEEIIRTVLEGTWDRAGKGEALNYWWGISSGVIDVIVSEHMSYYSKKLYYTLKEGISRETLSIFGGELRSQEGVIQKDGFVEQTNEQIIEMNWLNDNVIGAIPDASELIPGAVDAVTVAGVKDTESV